MYINNIYYRLYNDIYVTEHMNKNCALPKACGKLVVETEIVQHLMC